MINNFLCFYNQDFENRRNNVNTFNANNRWIKRGISLVPMKFLLEFYGTLQIYIAVYHRDGAVAVSHGGIECGQGINTKIAQVIAHTLDISIDNIFLRPTTDLIGANSAATGYSATSDMVCFVSAL